MIKNKRLLKIMLTDLVLVMILLFAFGCAEEDIPAEDITGVEEEITEEAALIDDFIILATTTSTYDSGLLDFLNPIFTDRTGLKVKVISQGTGAALETGSRGDVDLLLVHDRASELRLVEEGAFVDRHDVMYNDFIIVGPTEDPAGVLGISMAVEAYDLIANTGSIFISRGDDSGTHRMEVLLWGRVGIDPVGKNWYKAIGQGMGEALIMANEFLAYAMTDRGTYVAMINKLDLVVVFEGDPGLYNQYGVMAVNPDKHPHVKYDYALMYIDFLMSDEGQNLISAYQINGETLFFPCYGLE